MNYETGEGPTFRSVESYERTLQPRAEHAGQIDIGGIAHQSVNDSLLYLSIEYVRVRFSEDTGALSGNTLRSVYVALTSFFSWAAPSIGM
jgi:hypothetical protein